MRYRYIPAGRTVTAVQLDLSGNNIADISALVSLKARNNGVIYRYLLENNPLNEFSLESCIPELKSYGVQVYY